MPHASPRQILPFPSAAMPYLAFAEPLSPAERLQPLPSLWFGAPAPAALRAQRAVKAAGFVPAGFAGRAAALVVAGPAGEDGCYWSLEPYAAPPIEPGEKLPRADRLAGVSPDEVFRPMAAHTVLINGRGEQSTLLELADELRALRPERIARGGGKGLNLTHAHWNMALLMAAGSPAACVILERNRDAASGLVRRPVAFIEWWEGPTPPQHVKFSGMSITPRTTGKPLIERLLEGIDQAPDPRRADPAWTEKRPTILAETTGWIAVAKPSGLLSVPGTQGLADAMTLASRMTGSPLTAVHRLDMDTSGILIFSKRLDATQGLMAAFREGRVKKRYRARLLGELPAEEGLVDFPIATDPLDRLRQCAALGGRPSRTRWRRLSSHDGRTLVEFEPLTGRTHQLRLHAAHALGLGSPIDGDPYYSPAGLLAETPQTPLCLHAASIAFPDPLTGAAVELTLPEPFDV